MMAVDWDAIRHLDGSQSAGFEELCAQLARSESPSPDGFVRKGSPDAGVECFCTLPDGNEWGWQAKYFLELNSSRWSQIDESVKNALDKHPKMARYYICVPMNRADARLEGQTSALERWDRHVEKWQGWSHDHGMSVEFVWWGSSELVDRLSKPEHIGRMYYWFGKHGFKAVSMRHAALPAPGTPRSFTSNWISRNSWRSSPVLEIPSTASNPWQ